MEAQNVEYSGNEQILLESFFKFISQYSFDKAKELCDKEKESHKSFLAVSAPWTQMIGILSSMATVEKNYSASFGLKWFARKDNLRTSYSHLIDEFEKLEDCIKDDSQGSTNAVFEKLLNHLCTQICQYLRARCRMLDFYENIAVMGTNRNMSINDLLPVIIDIINSYQNEFHHPILSAVKHSYSLECEVIMHLMKSQLHMQHYEFLNSLLDLNEAHGKLSDWATYLPAKEDKKMFLAMSKGQTTPPLYEWYVKYKNLLVSKFGLYFHDVLSKQAPANELKTLLAKSSIDFHSKIVNFHKKSCASHVALVFDSTDLSYQKSFGYNHPLKVLGPVTGKDSFPAIFIYPPEKPDKRWPAVISIITEHSAELNNIDRHLYFFDETIQVTYFLSQIEPRITLVVIFESKKAEKDSYVNSFLVEITTQLRCTKLFSALRASIKNN